MIIHSEKSVVSRQGSRSHSGNPSFWVKCGRLNRNGFLSLDLYGPGRGCECEGVLTYNYMREDKLGRLLRDTGHGEGKDREKD
jgi:hypothetical protein